MITIRLSSETDFDGWRRQARALCERETKPEEIIWRPPSTAESLFEDAASFELEKNSGVVKRTIRATPKFLRLARRVVCHSDPARFALLYRVLCRLQNERDFLNNAAESSVKKLFDLDKSVRRDVHKFHAFVRFRKIGEKKTPQGDREMFGAWFEPSHYTVELSAPFFRRRFPNMDWMIVTPHRTAIWDGHDLRFAEGGQKGDAPQNDAVEDEWRTYFQSIFNPARLKIKAMTAEMPKKYWRNLPEADLIPSMVRQAERRVGSMMNDAVSEPSRLAKKLGERRS